jgi:PIN domain nuclease of toxin-antitoxin system
MRVLLDTHVFLWVVSDSPRLNAKTRQMIDSAVSIHVSSATIWEVAIKARLGKIGAIPEELLDEIEKCGFQELPVSGKHAVAVANLPLHHADPFDRILVAQAVREQMRLLTSDSLLRIYSDLVECI